MGGCLAWQPRAFDIKLAQVPRLQVINPRQGLKVRFTLQVYSKGLALQCFTVSALGLTTSGLTFGSSGFIWVVVKVRVPFWVP